MANSNLKSLAHITQLNWKHGHYLHPSYSSWLSMMQRCFNPRATKYYAYGARGITVCERWRSVENFIVDMGEKPKGYSIERSNNNGIYSCGFCPECTSNNWPRNGKWATMPEQALNKSSNHVIVFNDKSQTLKEWAVELGMKYSTLATRLMCYHWSVERALTEPVHPRRSRDG